jgi:hypothetical protein
MQRPGDDAVKATAEALRGCSQRVLKLKKGSHSGAALSQLLHGAISIYVVSTHQVNHAGLDKGDGDARGHVYDVTTPLFVLEFAESNDLHTTRHAPHTPPHASEAAPHRTPAQSKDPRLLSPTTRTDHAL